MVSRITRMSRDVGMEIAGPQGMLAGEDGPLHGALALQFLGAPAPSIYGGSDEVQHNIIGERVLGLPREPDASKDVPFRSLRTAVKFLGVERQVRVVQVTSPSPGEGKTMVAANLAVAFAVSLAGRGARTAARSA